MSFIRQEDITDGSIALTKVTTISFTTTSVYVQGNVTSSAYQIGVSSGFAATQPLSIKELGTDNQGWAEEEDFTVYNVGYTTVIPWFGTAGGIVVPTTATTSVTTGDLVGIYGPGAWSSGPSAVSSRLNGNGMGSANAAIVTGSFLTTTDLFNGSVWALGSNNQTLSRADTAGGGSQNAAWIACGDNSSWYLQTEIFNGATWALSGNATVSRQNPGSFGSQNSGLAAGGLYNGGTATANTSELFNGSTWAASGLLNVTRYACASFGTQNGGMIAGGGNPVPAVFQQAESFNGSSWAVSSLIAFSRSLFAGAGSQNAGIIICGQVPAGTQFTTTELFNGSTWYLSSNTTLSGSSGEACGSQNSTLAVGFGAAQTLTLLHAQTLYRKLTFNNLKEAKSIGIAMNVSASTCNVKIYGYVDNVAVSSSNVAITSIAQWAASPFVVLSRFSANAATTNDPPSISVKSSIEADDYLVGQAISITQMIVYNSNIFSKDNSGNW